MPTVKGKKYAYTPAGKAAAARARMRATKKRTSARAKAGKGHKK